MYDKSDIQLLRTDDGLLALYNPGRCGELLFYVTGSTESIAGLMVHTNMRIYVYDDFALNANRRHYDAHDIAYAIMSCVNSYFVTRKGRRPNIAVDIIDRTGNIVCSHTVVGVKH